MELVRQGEQSNTALAVTCPDGADLLLGHLREGAALASGVSFGVLSHGIAGAVEESGVRRVVWPATFLEHVGDVLFLRAEEQVRGIDAAWDITTVQDEQASGDGANEMLIRKAVRFALAAIEAKCTVALLEGCGSPQPAAIGFRGLRYFREEAGEGIACYTHGVNLLERLAGPECS